MIRDGTQERTLDPPEQRTYTERELREMEEAARDGFNAMDERARKWLDDQLADTPPDIANLVRLALLPLEAPFAGAITMLAAANCAVDRYIAECALDYAEDAT